MASHDIEPGHVLAEKYRVINQLGEGGMGQVYLVQHLKTDERFALKILNPSVAKTATTRERFRREAKTPARIDSDHVCRVVDTDIAQDLDGAPFLVMEYLRGQNLQDLSEDRGALPPKEVLIYLRHAASALDKAHLIGIVHRDLKPENLFLTTRDDGSPCLKVLDFGIAKLSGATGDLAQVKATQTGDVFGTPMYMSPEQCKSEADKISAQSDVWALGLITHRLLTGDDFWTANTLTHLIAQIAYEPMPSATERGANFGAAYEAWFKRCCSRVVAERFETAGEAVTALQDALGHGADSTAELSLDLVAAEVARAALQSQPGASSSASKRSSTGAGHQTSEALTLDPVDVRLGRRSRAPFVVAGVAVLALGGVLAWFGGVGRAPVDTGGQAGLPATAGDGSTTTPPAAPPSGTPSGTPSMTPAVESSAAVSPSSPAVSAASSSAASSTAASAVKAPPFSPSTSKRPRPAASSKPQAPVRTWPPRPVPAKPTKAIDPLDSRR